MYQKVYMTDGDSKSRSVNIKVGCSKSLRNKAVKCGREWRSRIVMIRADLQDPKLLDLSGNPAHHVMVRLSDFELGDRKPARKRTGKVCPYTNGKQRRAAQYKLQKASEKLVRKSKV